MAERKLKYHDHALLYTLVTPRMAEEILSRNTRNRPLKAGVVERYARDMAAKKWKHNAMPIRIAADGTLMDGQHRLWAVIESATPTDMILLDGLPEDAIDSIDNGAARGYSDYRTIRAKAEGQAMSYPNEFQAVLRWIYWYQTMWPSLSRGRVGSKIGTFAELDEIAEQYPKLTEYIGDAKAAVHKTHIIRQSTLAFVYSLAAEYDQNKAALWLDVLQRGVTDVPDHPALALRERMISAKVNREKLDPMHELVFVIKSWNAWAQGQGLRAVRWVGEELVPPIFGTDKWMGRDTTRTARKAATAAVSETAKGSAKKVGVRRARKTR
jgi:hypothetical protein